MQYRSIILTACPAHDNGRAITTMTEARAHAARWRASSRALSKALAAQLAHELSMGASQRACCPAAAFAREQMAAAYREAWDEFPRWDGD